LKSYWVAAFVLGLGISALAGPVLGAFPTTAYDVAPGFGSAVYAFEMAKTPADLVAVFGPEGDPERARRIEQMDRGNLWDFPFMVIYSLYMAVYFLAIRRESTRPVWLVFALVGLLAGCADAVENTILLNLTNDLAQAPGLGWLGVPVWTKFLSIMVCISASGFYLISQKHLLWKLLGLSSIGGGLTLLAAFLSPSDYGYLVAGGTTVGWVSMLLFAGYRGLLDKPR